MTKFSFNLRSKRTEKGLSQESLGALIGVGRTAINNYEKGVSEPSLDKLSSISKVLGTSLDWLVNGSSGYAVADVAVAAVAEKVMEYGERPAEEFLGLADKVKELEARVSKLEGQSVTVTRPPRQ